MKKIYSYRTNRVNKYFLFFIFLIISIADSYSFDKYIEAVYNGIAVNKRQYYSLDKNQFIIIKNDLNTNNIVYGLVFECYSSKIINILPLAKSDSAYIELNVGRYFLSKDNKNYFNMTDSVNLQQIDPSTGKILIDRRNIFTKNAKQFSFSDDGRYVSYSNAFLDRDSGYASYSFKVMDLNASKEIMFDSVAVPQSVIDRALYMDNYIIFSPDSRYIFSYFNSYNELNRDYLSIYDLDKKTCLYSLQLNHINEINMIDFGYRDCFYFISNNTIIDYFHSNIFTIDSISGIVSKDTLTDRLVEDIYNSKHKYYPTSDNNFNISINNSIDNSVYKTFNIDSIIKLQKISYYNLSFNWIRGDSVLLCNYLDFIYFTINIYTDEIKPLLSELIFSYYYLREIEFDERNNAFYMNYVNIPVYDINTGKMKAFFMMDPFVYQHRIEPLQSSLLSNIISCSGKAVKNKFTDYSINGLKYIKPDLYISNLKPDYFDLRLVDNNSIYLCKENNSPIIAYYNFQPHYSTSKLRVILYDTDKEILKSEYYLPDSIRQISGGIFYNHNNYLILFADNRGTSNFYFLDLNSGSIDKCLTLNTINNYFDPFTFSSLFTDLKGTRLLFQNKRGNVTYLTLADPFASSGYTEYQTIKEYVIHNPDLYSYCFYDLSSDGRYIIMPGPKILDTETDQIIKDYRSPLFCYNVKCSPDGKHIFGIADDYTVIQFNSSEFIVVVDEVKPIENFLTLSPNPATDCIELTLGANGHFPFSYQVAF